MYLKAPGRVVLGTTETPGWSAIEVIWVVYSSYRGSLVVHGSRLQKPGAIDVQSSNGPITGKRHAHVVAQQRQHDAWRPAVPGRDLGPLCRLLRASTSTGAGSTSASCWTRRLTSRRAARPELADSQFVHPRDHAIPAVVGMDVVVDRRR